MSRKTIINIISIIILLVVVTGVFLIVSNTKAQKEKAMENTNKTEKAEPALTAKKDKEEELRREKQKQEEAKKKAEEDKRKKQKKDKNDEKNKTKSNDAQTAELNKNTTFLLEKTIKGTKNSEEEKRVEELATENMIKQVEGADNSNSDNEVDIRNTSIKFKDTHDYTDTTINGTFKYDLIVKTSNNDKKSGTTQLNQTSAVTFIKKDGKYKLDKLSK